jgi:Flp pilus assembly protein TadD
MKSSRIRSFAAVVFAATAVAATGTSVLADARSDAREQVDFGINVAQRGLWREAIYRWEKAVELDPKYAAAFNDLGIAYEHEGQLEKARKAYEKALALEPNNANIRQNYDLFKEINDRAAQPKDKQ